MVKNKIYVPKMAKSCVKKIKNYIKKYEGIKELPNDKLNEIAIKCARMGESRYINSLKSTTPEWKKVRYRFEKEDTKDTKSCFNKIKKYFNKLSPEETINGNLIMDNCRKKGYASSFNEIRNNIPLWNVKTNKRKERFNNKLCFDSFKVENLNRCYKKGKYSKVLCGDERKKFCKNKNWKELLIKVNKKPIFNIAKKVKEIIHPPIIDINRMEIDDNLKNGPNSDILMITKKKYSIDKIGKYYKKKLEERKRLNLLKLNSITKNNAQKKIINLFKNIKNKKLNKKINEKINEEINNEINEKINEEINEEINNEMGINNSGIPIQFEPIPVQQDSILFENINENPIEKNNKVDKKCREMFKEKYAHVNQYWGNAGYATKIGKKRMDDYCSNIKNMERIKKMIDEEEEHKAGKKGYIENCHKLFKLKNPWFFDENGKILKGLEGLIKKNCDEKPLEKLAKYYKIDKLKKYSEDPEYKKRLDKAIRIRRRYFTTCMIRKKTRFPKYFPSNSIIPNVKLKKFIKMCNPTNKDNKLLYKKWRWGYEYDYKKGFVDKTGFSRIHKMRRQIRRGKFKRRNDALGGGKRLRLKGVDQYSQKELEDKLKYSYGDEFDKLKKKMFPDKIYINEWDAMEIRRIITENVEKKRKLLKMEQSRIARIRRKCLDSKKEENNNRYVKLMKTEKGRQELYKECDPYNEENVKKFTPNFMTSKEMKRLNEINEEPKKKEKKNEYKVTPSEAKYFSKHYFYRENGSGYATNEDVATMKLMHLIYPSVFRQISGQLIWEGGMDTLNAIQYNSLNTVLQNKIKNSDKKYILGKEYYDLIASDEKLKDELRKEVEQVPPKMGIKISYLGNE